MCEAFAAQYCNLEKGKYREEMISRKHIHVGFVGGDGFFDASRSVLGTPINCIPVTC